MKKRIIINKVLFVITILSFIFGLMILLAYLISAPLIFLDEQNHICFLDFYFGDEIFAGHLPFYIFEIVFFINTKMLTQKIDNNSYEKQLKLCGIAKKISIALIIIYTIIYTCGLILIYSFI